MASHTKPITHGEPNEYETFSTALKKVLSVPHSTMKAKLDAEKRTRTKKSSVARASRPSHASH